MLEAGACAPAWGWGFPSRSTAAFHLCCRRRREFPGHFPLGALWHLQGWELSELWIWGTLKRAEFSSQHSLPLQVCSAPFRGSDAASAYVGLELGAAVPGSWGTPVLLPFYSQEADGKMSLLLERGSAPGHALAAAVCSPGMELFL